MTGSPFIDDPRFENLFPAFVVVGRNGRILSIGKELAAITQDIAPQFFDEHFEIINPPSTQNLWDFLESGHEVTIKYQKPPHTLLAGHVIDCPEIDALVYCANVRGIDQEAKAPAFDQTRSFLGQISQRLLIPLKAILGMSHLLEKTTLDKQQLDYLDAMYCSSEEILALAEKLNDLHLLESDQLSLQPVVFNPAQLIDEMLNNLEHSAYKRNNIIERDINIDPDIWLLGDSVRFAQIVAHLSSNAIRFTQDGTIRVSCSATVADNNCILTTRVLDTGVGIDQDKLNTLLNVSRPPAEGTTLGLSVCRGLVKKLGGSIKAESTLGMGSYFSFSVSFSVNPRGSKHQVDEDQQASFKFDGMSALVVEDQDLQQILARTVLETEGVEVHIAQNGKAGIRMMREKDYDFVLMDIQMPIMNGLEATRIIREEFDSRVPIIAITGQQSDANPQVYLDAGMDGLLLKPYDPQELKNTIARVCSCEKSENRGRSAISTGELYEGTDLKFDLGRIVLEMNGNRDLIIKRIETFLVEAPGRLNTIRSNMNDRRWHEVRKLVLSLKGEMEHLGIKAAIPYATEIEIQMLERTNLTTVMELFENLEATLTAALLDLAQEMEDLRNGKALPPD